MPTDIPGPLPAWASTLVNLTGGAGHSYLFDLLAYFNEVGDADNLKWAHCAVHVNNNATTDTADDAVIGFDIANITGGSLDVTWTTTDFTQCETALTTFLTSCVGNMHNGWTFDKYSWYLKTFNPYTESKPFADAGPPVRATTIAVTGSSSGYMPPQVALTVTERTAWPNHWGRFYIPGISGTMCTTSQHASSTVTAALANAYNTLVTNLQGNGFFMVVPTTQVNKVPNRGLLTVTSVQVDDIFDVVRRRRFRTPTVRSIKP